MRVGWGWLVAVIGAAGTLGVVYPELYAAFLAPPSSVLEETSAQLPNPPWWVLTTVIIAGLGAVFFPSQRQYEQADEQRKLEIRQTRRIMAGAIVFFTFIGLYLFIWVGWSLRVTLL
jgi:hypothetical protein